MIKSAWRLAKFFGLRKSTLVDGRRMPTSAFTNLCAITSRNVCTTQVCGKEIRVQNEKMKVGNLKYGLVEGETIPETANINQLWVSVSFVSCVSSYNNLGLVLALYKNFKLCWINFNLHCLDCIKDSSLWPLKIYFLNLSWLYRK